MAVVTETWTPEQYRNHISKKSTPKKKKGNGSKAKDEMEMMLKLAGYDYEKELKFHPSRKWRFDYAIPSLKIGIEYEGIMSEKSRHTTITGMTGDTEKYNAAQAQGWKVLRFTALNYKNLITAIKQQNVSFIDKGNNS